MSDTVIDAANNEAEGKVGKFQVRWTEGEDNCSSSSWHQSEKAAKEKARKLSEKIGQASVIEVEGDAKELVAVRSWLFTGGKQLGQATDEGRRKLDPRPEVKMKEEKKQEEAAPAEAPKAETPPAKKGRGKGKATEAPAPAASNDGEDEMSKSTAAAKKAPVKKAGAKAPTPARKAVGAAAAKVNKTVAAAKAVARTKATKYDGSEQSALDVLNLQSGSLRGKVLAKLAKNVNKEVSYAKIAQAVCESTEPEAINQVKQTVRYLEVRCSDSEFKKAGFKIERREDEKGEWHATLHAK